MSEPADIVELQSPPEPPRPRSTEGQLIYAVGDIHGRYDLLKAALAQIAADAAIEGRGRTPLLVLLGDYIDRGPESAKVLQALVWLQRRSEFVLHPLKGNHEQGLLAFLEEPGEGEAWLDYGGAETLAAYGVAPPPLGSGRESLCFARDALLDEMPASHLLFLSELELMVRVGDYAFVHAGVRPDRPLASQTAAELLWIRRGFIDAPGPFERVIVHGHTWLSDKPQVMEHRLGLDTGAYATGVLTVARLDEGTVQLFQARAGE
jgi:serine/threonine protein phosphatase 1